MKLFLISQTVNDGYDTYDSAIVAAISPEKAKLLHPSSYREVWPDWANESHPIWADKPEQVNVKYVGRAKNGTRQGVICSSFNAG